MRFVGCALAWRPGEAREKVSCLVVLDERGSIIANSFVAGAEEIARRVEEPGAAKAVAASEAVRLAVSEAQSTLGEEGRVLLRPSGTEPVVRVMVEHTDETVCREVCEEISRAVYDAGKEGT